jgi:hypothetical protein
MCTVPAATNLPMIPDVQKPLTTKSEYYVYACAFMLSSGLDLGKLKSKFCDVLHDYGKDYLVLSFRPSQINLEQIKPSSSYLPRANGGGCSIHDLPGARSREKFKICVLCLTCSSDGPPGLMS